MSAYNLSTNSNESSHQLHFRCFDDNTLFILTHLIEKYLAVGWQSKLENALKIEHPDSYQFHCYIIKKGKFTS